MYRMCGALVRGTAMYRAFDRELCAVHWYVARPCTVLLTVNYVRCTGTWDDGS